MKAPDLPSVQSTQPPPATATAPPHRRPICTWQLAKDAPSIDSASRPAFRFSLLLRSCPAPQAQPPSSLRTTAVGHQPCPGLQLLQRTIGSSMTSLLISCVRSRLPQSPRGTWRSQVARSSRVCCRRSRLPRSPRDTWRPQAPSEFPSLQSEPPTFAEPPRPLPLPLCSSAERPSTAPEIPAFAEFPQHLPEIPVFAEFPRPETPGHSEPPSPHRHPPTPSRRCIASSVDQHFENCSSNRCQRRRRPRQMTTKQASSAWRGRFVRTAASWQCVLVPT